MRRKYRCSQPLNACKAPVPWTRIERIFHRVPVEAAADGGRCAAIHGPPAAQEGDVRHRALIGGQSGDIGEQNE
jgi:hypothetical protein